MCKIFRKKTVPKAPAPEVSGPVQIEPVYEEEEIVQELPVPLPVEYTRDLTEKMVFEILEHEAIVPEMYLDSENIPTWGVGVTDASGHFVGRYKHNPQTIERCIEVYIWLLRNRYLPGVLHAFSGTPLKEHELCAALSFHYNTGAIGVAEWVKSFKRGNRDRAYLEFMNWSKPKSIIGRRKSERDLFFKEHWTQDGVVLVYDVGTNLRPINPRQVDVRNDVINAMK